jgi:hypothetical protein
MSTAKFDTLSNVAGTQTVPVATVAQGSAKAWVNFNGTGTVAIRAAFNVTSITDNGAGDYTVNFTTALPDANYATVAHSWDTSGGGFLIYGKGGVLPTTSAVRLSTSSTVAFNDSEVVNVAIFR